MSDTEQLDVLIIGAGLSGIGAAREIQAAFPDRSYAVLEARDAIGGTWDLFRYPGVRSDSDMHTLGYSARPWTRAKAIVDGPSIRQYIRDTAAEAGIDSRIRFRHKVTAVSWSSQDARWTVEADHDGTQVRLTARFLYVCTGYYRYDAGYQPDFPGLEDFEGAVVHPQKWPEDLDYSGKRVVVIGSGATAITLVPAMTDKAAHVTMLQRTPTYITSLPETDPMVTALSKVIGEERAYPIVKWKNVLTQGAFYQLCQRHPGIARAALRRLAVRQLPQGFDVDTHFKPPYNPWDQRLCVVPNGDLFRVLREGSASIVTDRIESFTKTGLRLKSGAELEADIVVTATGLRLLALGDIEMTVDGTETKLPDTMSYKGMMLSGVPNAAYTIGYTNASWTLKADLVAQYVVRLLRHMDAHGYDQAVPVADPAVGTRPLLDFEAGYVLRSVQDFPKAGDRGPWSTSMSYVRDIARLRFGKVDDPEMKFSRLPQAPAAETEKAPAAASAG